MRISIFKDILYVRIDLCLDIKYKIYLVAVNVRKW